MKIILAIIFNPFIIYNYFSYGVLLSAIIGWLIVFLYPLPGKGVYYKALITFLILTFSLIPFIQLTTNSFMYLEPIDGNSTATVLWFLFVITFIFTLKLLEPKEINYIRTNKLTMPTTRAGFYIITFLSGLSYLYFISKFGGVGGLLADYDVRLESSVTDHNALKGMGVLQALANVFPVFLFFILVKITRKDSFITFLFLSFMVIVLSFLVSGIFGSRQGVIFVIWSCFWLWHRTKRNFSPTQIKNLFMGGVGLMLIMMPLKFFGSDASMEKLLEFNELRRVNVVAGPLGFLLLRDVGRFDVQNVITESLINDELDIQYGKTLVGGALAPIPSAIFPNKPWSPTDVKNELFLGEFWGYQTGTTLLVGLPGEFIINFGYFGYMLFAIALCVLLTYIVKVNGLAVIDSRFVFFEVFLIPLPFLFFIFDSNVIGFYIFKWLVLFSLVSFFCCQKRA